MDLSPKAPARTGAQEVRFGVTDKVDTQHPRAVFVCRSSLFNPAGLVILGRLNVTPNPPRSCQQT